MVEIAFKLARFSRTGLFLVLRGRAHNYGVIKKSITKMLMKLRLCLHSRYRNQLKTEYNEQKLWSPTGHVKIRKREVGGSNQKESLIFTDVCLFIAMNDYYSKHSNRFETQQAA